MSLLGLKSDDGPVGARNAKFPLDSCEIKGKGGAVSSIRKEVIADVTQGESIAPACWAALGELVDVNLLD